MKEKIKLTAEEIYHRLIHQDRILEVQGQIAFSLSDVSIIVKQKDVVGNIMQEWLQGWLDQHHVAYSLSDNTQMPPDFYLDPEDETSGLLEIKAFNRLASPGFDIADFNAYQHELISKPYMLHVDYLIFGYEMTADGHVFIRDLWLKKVWQICRRMEDWPLNLQVKKGVVHKIRPCVWYSERNTKYPPFRCLEDFVSAIEETVHQNPDTRQHAGAWLVNFRKAYHRHCGQKLSIPRWRDIEDDYVSSLSFYTKDS